MTTDLQDDLQHIAVVGAGLVGALEACLLAKKGYKVSILLLTENDFFCNYFRLGLVKVRRW